MEPIRIDEKAFQSRRNFLNSCCCRKAKSSITLKATSGPQETYEYVVDKLVLKRVPVKSVVVPPESKEAPLAKPPPPEFQTIERPLKPLVFSSYHQVTPEKYICGGERKQARSNKDITPIHSQSFEKPRVPLRMTAFARTEDLPSADEEQPVDNDRMRTDGRYLLRKIASDLSNHKDVKWKIIIKKNRSKSTSEPQDTDIETLSTFGYNGSDYSH